MEIIVNGITFPSKAAVDRHCREILARTPIGETLGGADRLFMLDLIKRHPSYCARFVGRLEAIGVELAPPIRFKNRRFFARYKDGTEEPFAWAKCLGTSEPGKVEAALRNEVKDQVLAFRREAFKTSQTLTCPVSGDTITFFDSHVDHEYPDTFIALVRVWAEDRSLDLAQIELRARTDGWGGDDLVDRALAKDFAEYHRRHARLRCVTSWANIKMGPNGTL